MREHPISSSIEYHGGACAGAASTGEVKETLGEPIRGKTLRRWGTSMNLSGVRSVEHSKEQRNECRCGTLKRAPGCAGERFCQAIFSFRYPKTIGLKS